MWHSPFLPSTHYSLNSLGLNILSTYKGSPTAVSTLSGTSMASPHVAGLLAYLLSIYPSEQFNPTITEPFIPITLKDQYTFASPFVYSITHAILPRWVSELLPLPRLTEAVTAPTPKPPKTLTPLQLKTALIALSTKGLLSELPAETVNLLVFNNATTS
jgi:cerevisin